MAILYYCGLAQAFRATSIGTVHQAITVNKGPLRNHYSPYARVPGVMVNDFRSCTAKYATSLAPSDI